MHPLRSSHCLHVGGSCSFAGPLEGMSALGVPRKKWTKCKGRVRHRRHKGVEKCQDTSFDGCSNLQFAASMCQMLATPF